jgi:acid phosphatase type 7
VGYGGNTNARFITTYFRKAISIANASSYGSFTLNVKRDDGIVVYVNGVEKYRNNLPTSTITNTTLASAAASDDGANWQTTTLAAGTFITGTNVIAVEMHQSSATSSDLSFDLELKGNAPAAAVLIRGPYLQIGTSNSVVVRWRTDIANDAKVNYGLSADSLTSVATNASSVTEHEIQLTGLAANTKYFYSIGSSSQTLQGDANNFFVTAPVVGTEKKTRVWVNGDCGNNSTNQKNVLNQYLNYMGTNYTDLWLLLGDNAYDNGTDAEYQTKFFDIYKDKLLKQSVLWPSPGNHEYGSNATRMNDHAIAYYDIFTVPKTAQAGGVASNTESFYSYNYGNVHFISLDSYGKESNTYRLYDTLGPQVVWLKQDLAANTQKWTVAYWHHAPYSLTSHNSDTETELVNIRQNLLKILERYKVDLVLCGHSHGYERSKLLKGHYGNEASFTAAMNVSQSSGKYDGSASSCPYVKNNASSYDGTVYVVAGSAGQLSSATQSTYPHAAMYYSNVSNGGSLVLEIEANRLDAKWVCADGVIRDKFTIEKDVSVKNNISITPGSSTTLSASWIGNYSWTGGATTRSITVAPAISTTYIVNDSIGCVADTFNVTIAAARPVSQKVSVADGRQSAIKIYPNPTAGNTTIEYTSLTDGHVSLYIFDIAGRRVKTLVNQLKKAGTYKHVINTKNEQLAPGIYSVNLATGKQKNIQQFIVTQE